MSVGISTGRMAWVGLFALTLTSCFHPPYNNFQEDKRTLRYSTFGGGFGAMVGAIAGGVAGSVAAGAVVGGVSGSFIGYQKNLRPAIIKELQKQDIQYVQYGDTITLIVPTDNYYLFNSPVLNELSYPGLMNIVRLLKFYPCTPVYVAAFTDNVGSRRHKKMLSQAQAETMLTFLWAHNIDAHRLRAEGYSDKHPIGDNRWIHGSAYNRRIEIQWLNTPGQPSTPPMAYLGMTK